MSMINKKLVGFLFNGATQALATADWKNNVNAIYGFNSAGDGYQVFKPTSNFNSLTQLKQDGSYIVDTKMLGFELPGATLTVSGGTTVAGTITVTTLTPTMTGDGLEIEFGASSTNGGFITAIVQPPTNSSGQLGISAYSLTGSLETIYTAMTDAGKYYVHFYDAMGATTTRDFTITA